VPLLVGLGIAELIYHYTGSAGAYDKKIDLVREYELHWMFAAALVVSKLSAMLNYLPLAWKNLALPTKMTNARVNQFVYRVVNTSGDEGRVLLDDAGAAGAPACRPCHV